MSVRGRWYLTRAAVECYMRLRRLSSDADFARAEDEMIALSESAHLVARDPLGRELWRTGRPLRLRWVVVPGPHPQGPLPQVVWVGQGRPANAWWSGD